MKYLLFAGSLILFALLMGCNSPESKVEKRADEICECVKETGITDLDVFSLQDRSEMRAVEQKTQKVLPRKLLKVFRKIEQDLDYLSLEKKKRYTRELMKALVDTECMDETLNKIPYSLLGLGLDKMEEQINQQGRSRRATEREAEEEAVY